MVKPIKKISEKINTLSVKVRHGATADLSSMTNLLEQLFSIESDFTPNIRKQRQGLATLMQSDEATMLVAVANGDVIGMITMQPLISTAEGGLVGVVEDLIIAKEWRKKGVGSMLLKAIEAEAIAQGMTRLQLHYDSDNKDAELFYASHQWNKTHMVVMRKTY